jgi:hypothetical protein
LEEEGHCLPHPHRKGDEDVEAVFQAETVRKVVEEEEGDFQTKTMRTVILE